MVSNVEGELNWNGISGVAPFISRVSLEKLVDKKSTVRKVDAKHITHLAPFLGSELLGRVVNNINQGGFDWHVIVALAPFLNYTDLVILIERIGKHRILPEHIS